MPLFTRMDISVLNTYFYKNNIYFLSIILISISIFYLFFLYFVFLCFKRTQDTSPRQKRKKKVSGKEVSLRNERLFYKKYFL